MPNTKSAMKRFGLSKSRITAFEQCPKRLWLQVHRPELAVLDQAAKGRFAAGHEVGEIACSLCPGGIMISAEPDLSAAVARTAELLEDGYKGTLFEATFAHDGVLVRADIMTWSGANGWDVAEVKSSTQAKDYHSGDLATQLWVMAERGVPVSSASIRHIDNTFVLEREGDYHGLFADVRLDDQLGELIARRPVLVSAARRTLAGPEPELDMGEHCQKPFPCEFSQYCRSRLPPPPEWPVSLLPNSGRKIAAEWAERGVSDLRDVPEGALTSELHKRIHRATLTGEPFHDVAGARARTAGWSFPRTYLDFETIGFAAPRWVGTRPYEQVPFQFSAHVEQADGQVTHHEFLSLDGSDPRPACTNELVRLIPDQGAVIAYNSSFERDCISRLGKAIPDFAPDLEKITSRLVDLHPVTRSCWYHRDQRDSWSIKAVLPTVAPDLQYEGLDVKEGMAAQQAYVEAIAPDTSEARRKEIAAALKAYCAMDTKAMIALLRRLLSSDNVRRPNVVPPT